MKPKDVLRILLRDKLAVFALVFLAVFYLVGIVASIANFLDFDITPFRYEEMDYKAIKASPSLVHWFGTDLIGRDIFTRVVYSMGTSVELTILVVLFGGLFIGVAVGLIAGYFGGRIDSIFMRAGEVIGMIPPFFLFIFLTSSLRPRYEELFYSWGVLGEWFIKEGIVDFSLIFFVFSLFYWVGSARVIRSEVLKLRELPYVDTARVLGASSARIIWRHILPNLWGIIILWGFSTLASVVVLEVGLSWFGLGIRPPHPSFGVLISEITSLKLLVAYPHLLLFPGVIVSLFIFSCNMLSMRLTIIVQSFYTTQRR